MSFTITDLKRHLGPGLGLRKNKYLIEIPVPTVDGATLNILCRSAGLPERNISTVTAWHKGRQYNMRGETDYIGTYDISILDDSDMQIRKLFDTWLKQIDNSKPANAGILGASFEQVAPGFLSQVKQGIGLINDIKSIIKNPKQLLNFTLDALAGNYGAIPSYQTDVNIWQLDNQGNKVYGYKLENAFPKSVGIVQLDDGDENTLSEFSVTFAFSEFTPLTGIKEQVISTVFGDQANDILNGVEALFS